MRKFLSLSLFVSCVSMPMFARPEFSSIQERAQGYSLTAATMQNDSLYANPAASAFTNVYTVEGVFSAPRSFGVSILDTKTSPIGGSLGYFREPSLGSSKALQGIKFGLMGRLSETVGIGLSGKSVWGPDNSGNQYRMNDGDLGALFNLSPLLLGASVRNVLGGKSAVGFGREVSVGARLSYEDLVHFSVSAESAWGRWSPEQYGFGLEYVSPYYFSLKGGFRIRPGENRSYWSGGASLLSPKILLHYAVEFPQNQPSESIQHSVAAAMQF